MTGEGESDAPADPAAGSGDDGHLSFEPLAHFYLLSFRFLSSLYLMPFYLNILDDCYLCTSRTLTDFPTSPDTILALAFA